MKGKTVFWSSIITGATLGGVLSLLHGGARQYVNEKTSTTSDQLSYLKENPTETVRKVKQSVLSLNEAVTHNTKSALNALEQVEKTVDRLLK